ncbi:MAG: hypothetical protein WA510_14670 [Acidobacteriaceae bacterium]
MHVDSSFAQWAFNDAAGRVRLDEVLAREKNGVALPAQPGFATGVANKPPHPAERAGQAGCCGIRERGHAL